jgi:hypothetical protein
MPSGQSNTADPRRSLERLSKWRSLFAGWQLGTRAVGDPESDAVRDHREATIIQRAELSALTALLVKKGVFTAEEFSTTLAREADQLSQDYERRFPGVTATDIGLQIDHRAAQTMKGWLP